MRGMPEVRSASSVSVLPYQERAARRSPSRRVLFPAPVPAPDPDPDPDPESMGYRYPILFGLFGPYRLPAGCWPHHAEKGYRYPLPWGIGQSHTVAVLVRMLGAS